jgi:molybdate transport system substrate-binding protein
MQFRRLAIVVIFFLTSLPACNNQAAHPTRDQITVFAAASLTEAFSELGRSFEAANPGASVVFNFAGSQQLAQQLAQGAPGDVFASANQTQMDAAIQAGRVEEDKVNELVSNQLVVIIPADNPAGINSLQDLARPGVKLILADSSVPAGQYSLAFLDKATQSADFEPGFKNSVLKNVVSYEENVRSVLSKVSLGEADAGVVYISDAVTDKEGKLAAIPIPETLNVPATYLIAPIDDSQAPELAMAFVTYALSPAGQTILEQYGFSAIR